MQVVHQPALLDRQNLIESSCNVETDSWCVLYQCLVLQLLSGQPAFVGTTEVQLVTVFLSLDTTKYRTEFRQLYLAYAV